MRLKKMLLMFLMPGCLLGLLSLWAINAHIGRAAKPFLYSAPQQVPSAYTALILGAKVYAAGAVSNMLEDRLLTGWELYQQGKVQKLLLSGDPDEVNAMWQYLLKQGVAPEDIFMDHAGFRTYDSMYRARDVFQVQAVIIVTQEFHLARAVYLARALGLAALGLAADRRPYTTTSQLKADIREIFARVKAFIDVHVWKAAPKYLGRVIPITGDGRRTWD